MRTQDEIVAHIRAGDADRLFPWDIETLVPCLDYEHAKPWLKPDLKPEDWRPVGEEEVRQGAVDYLKFAWAKAEDHRGISASRSVEKMLCDLWLLGLDDAVAEMEAAGYAQYGAPKLAVAAKALGQPLPTSEALVRMMRGDECVDGCEIGCGQ